MSRRPKTGPSTGAAPDPASDPALGAALARRVLACLVQDLSHPPPPDADGWPDEADLVNWLQEAGAEVPSPDEAAGTEIPAPAEAAGSVPPIDATALRRPSTLRMLLTALRFCTALDSPDALRGLAERGSHTQLVLPPELDPGAVARDLEALLPLIDRAAPLHPPALAQVRVHARPTPRATGGARDAAPETARTLLLEADLHAHEAVLFVTPPGGDAGPRLAPTRRATQHLAPVTRVMLADLRAAVFPESRRDRKTDADVADGPADTSHDLPGDAALTRLDPGLIAAAFCAETADEAAACLRRYAARLPPAAPRMTLDAMALDPAVSAPLDRLARDVARWRDGALDWAAVPRSVLLHGPPGTGKTMLAEALAGTLEVPRVATSYAECQAAGHLGQYLAAMQARVDDAIAQAPCLFFLDEVDSFTRRDGSSGRGAGDANGHYLRQVVNGMLAQLTRLHETPGVILLAATNHLEQVDPALRRPGRFDLTLALGLPDRAGIARILRAGLGTARADADAIEETARALVGHSGATAAAVARAALSHARDAAAPPGRAQFAAALAALAPAPSSDALRRRAAHEAGHAVVAAALGLPLPGRITLGATDSTARTALPTALTHDAAQDWCAVLLAGRAAERVLLGAPSTLAGDGPGSDLDQATSLLMRLDLECGLGDSGLTHAPVDTASRAFLPPWLRARTDGLLREAEGAATRILRCNAGPLRSLAARLADERQLDGTDIAVLLKDVSREAPQASVPAESPTIIPFR